ncbi:MAG: DUF3300 domain-containing protein [Azoarcus sp.]|nr:DUF3300 domain-containing protein [Azoarcus sp.]
MEIRFLSASRVGRNMLAAAAAGLISLALPALAQEDAYLPDAAENQADLEISQETLDGLLAPIALYPDALLAQVLMATTYPVDVLEAADWERKNSGLSEQALQDALAAFDWDPSVKSLVSVPQVLHYMSDSPQWMRVLGRAVTEDQPRVMASVQALRKKARAAGNLASNSRQTVVVDMDEARRVEYITITPMSHRVIYVPAYRPDIVYGTWWWPSRPYYWGSPPSGVLLGSGFFWSNVYFPSAALWGGFNWGGREMVVNVPAYRRYYRASPPKWARNVWRPSRVHRHPGFARHHPRRAAEHRLGRSPDRKWVRPSEQRPPRSSWQRPPRSSERQQVRPSGWRSARPLDGQRPQRPSGWRSARSTERNQARPSDGHRPPRSSEWRSARSLERNAIRSPESSRMRSPESRPSRFSESRPAVGAQPSKSAARSFGRSETRIRHERPRESPRSSNQRASRRDSWRGDGRSGRR